MKQLFYCLTFFLICSCSGKEDHHRPKKVLIIGSNARQFYGQGAGVFIENIAGPFHQFMTEGYEVDIMTPLGGQAVTHSSGYLEADMISYAKDKTYLRKVSHSLTPDLVEPDNYDGIFIPGHHGLFSDVVDNKTIQKLLARAFEKGIVIGCVGHGAAVLVHTTKSDGSYVVKDIKMTCIANWTEESWCRSSNYGRLLPFSTEDELKKQGAIVSLNNMRNLFEDRLVIDKDHRMVSSAFDEDSEEVADQMIDLMDHD